MKSIKKHAAIARYLLFCLLMALANFTGLASITYLQNPDLDAKQRAFFAGFSAESTSASIQLFEFDFSALNSNRLTLTLPSGQIVSANRVQSSVEYGSRAMWVGKGEDIEIHLAPNTAKEMLTGHVLVSGNIFSIKSLSGGLQAMIEYDDSQTAGCENHDNKEVLEPPSRIDDRNFTNGKEAPQLSAEDLQDECYIRILVAYTTEVSIAESDPLGLIMTAVSLANTGYANSGIDQQLQLVRVYETSVVESDVTLTNWKNLSDGYMDEVHTERNLHDADMCALITNSGTGVAYVNVSPTLAFSLTNRTYISGFTFHHELGHNHGCFHDPLNNTTGAGSDYQGYGHPLGYFRTVMAYGSACGASPCTRVNEFSGPLNFYFHAPTFTFYTTGKVDQNNVLGHNTNNGDVVDHRTIPTNLAYSGSYDFEEFELANFAGESTASYQSSVNQMIYQDGAVGSFSAGDRITLGVGFSAHPGSEFTAYLEDVCTPITRHAEGASQAELAELGVDKQSDLSLSDLSVFPNPFSDQTKINFTLGESSAVSLRLFDLNGQLIRIIFEGQQAPGQHFLKIDGTGLPAGIYYCHIRTNENSAVVKVNLIR